MAEKVQTPGTLRAATIHPHSAEITAKGGRAGPWGPTPSCLQALPAWLPGSRVRRHKQRTDAKRAANQPELFQAGCPLSTSCAASAWLPTLPSVRLAHLPGSANGAQGQGADPCVPETRFSSLVTRW